MFYKIHGIKKTRILNRNFTIQTSENSMRRFDDREKASDLNEKGIDFYGVL
jgi:hypothetical protein